MINLLQATDLAPVLERVRPVVFDVGARGQLDKDCRVAAWATAVVGFEAEVNEAARLKARPEACWRNVSIVPVALGPSTGIGRLHLPASPSGASLLYHNDKLIELFGHETLHRTIRAIDVDTITLDDALREFNLPRPDYLKLDIEGAELGVLQAGADALSGCTAIKVECAFQEQRVGQPLADEVIAFLRTQGFALAEIRDIHSWRRRPIQGHPRRILHQAPYSRGVLAQADLVFLRTPESLADGDAALRAVVTGTVLGFVDYAIGIVRLRPSIEAVCAEPQRSLEAAILSASKALGGQAAWSSLKESFLEFMRCVRCALNLMPADRHVLPY